jgi:uncharacterized YigZ family protein
VDRYIIPARQHRVETVVVNSRFIATMAPVFSVEEAKAFAERVKREFADASHNVSAYVVGHGNTVVAHCTDDGEPSGTAGRPALAVLRGSGLGDAAVVVTRYFGGTKLGAGGLVRAYGDAVRSVLATVPRAVRASTHTAKVIVPYPLYERVVTLVEAHDGEVQDREFETEVTVVARFPVDRLDGFRAALQEASNGALAAVIVHTDDRAILPVNAIERSTVRRPKSVHTRGALWRSGESQ